MEFVLQNELLKLRVSETGAELVSAQDKRNGLDWIWAGSSRFLKEHAPVLFPYCGKLYGGAMRVDGVSYPAQPNGFAKGCEFACIDRTPDKLGFRLCDNDETHKLYPYPFELAVTYELFGNQVQVSAEVKNPGVAFSMGDDPLPFSLGFMPAFSLGRDASCYDYKLVFDRDESPTEIYTSDEDFMSGQTGKLFMGQKILPMRDTMFSNGSICLTGLESNAVTLMNSKTGRAVEVGISDFQYLMLWGAPKGPLPFVCIGPWNGLPDPDVPYGEFSEKPAQMQLLRGESYQVVLTYTFF